MRTVNMVIKKNMKRIEWDENKNKQLCAERGISFESVVVTQINHR